MIVDDRVSVSGSPIHPPTDSQARLGRRLSSERQARMVEQVGSRARLHTLDGQDPQLGGDPARRGESQMTTPQLIEAAQDVLLQGLGLLFEVSDRTYSRVARAPFNASIGQHFRHVLEHFQCLIRGLRSKEINYDARERNTRIESEVVYSSVATCDVLRAIKGWDDRTLNAA